MNYKFYQAESRLYDFLIFPRFLYYSEEKERTQGQSNYEEYIEPEYHHFAKKLGEQLELFREDIAPFYHSQFSNDFDFIDLLLKGTGLIGFKDEQHYLANLATLSSREIQTYILSAMLVINSECSKIKEAKDKAEQMSEDPARVRSFIKELPIEAGTKWHLSLILEDPQEYVRRYVVLMEKLLPIFKQFYEPFTKQVQAYGAYLVNILNTEGILGVQRLTSSNVNVKSLEGEAINSIMVSAFFAYGLTITASPEQQYMIWGIKVEEAFRKIVEINENRMLERVLIFKNLGDKTRYEVLKIFASGETSTKEIAKALGVTSATVSYHINNLAIAKILTLGKQKDKISYELDYDFLKEIIKGLKEDLLFPE